MSTDPEIPFGPDRTLDDVFSAGTVSPEGLLRVSHAALQRIDAVRVSLQEIIDLSWLEGAEEAYKRCYEDLGKMSETCYDDILRAVDSPREETKAVRQTVVLGSAIEASRGVLRAPGTPQRAPSLMRAPSQDPDGDLASTLKDIKVRLDSLDRLGQPPSGVPPTSLPEQGPSSIPLQVDPNPRPFPSPSIPDGQQALTKDGIPTQVPSVTPGTYTNNGWTATNKTPETGDADARRLGLPTHYNPGPAPYSPDNAGPEGAGLQPHSAMWVKFKDFVSYLAYHLNNIRANVRDSENKRIGKMCVASRISFRRSETSTAASPSRCSSSYEHYKKGSTPCGHRKAQRSARWPSCSEATPRISTNREVSLRRRTRVVPP